MSEPVTVRILDREYTVGVSEEERAGLYRAFNEALAQV